MSRYLIEVHHEAEPLACARAIQVFLATGSHFMTQADWGCLDGDHTGRIVVELESKEQARSILPPAYRSQARIIALYKFTMDQINGIISQHQQS